MDTLARLAEGFIGLFQAGGEQFTNLVKGILPTLIVLITGVNAIIQIVGEKRVERLIRWTSSNFVTRYTLMPVLAMFFLTNPMAYTFGKFLPEKYKPAFYDAAVSFCHPITGLFPHANPGEIFIYAGVATGITQLGLPLGDLAVRYFLVGVIVIFIRGIVTERITAIMWQKNEG
ncbi:MAG: PTS glucitol/sorbitol transporter subunit IIC [Peptostreptococcaceae bacterium]|nr:PTS glucitol/sorbitol transporter subunit IIC [Peptostreptococcaceae bacterium]